MYRSKGKGRAFARTTITLAAAAAAMAAGDALAKTVPFSSGQFVLASGKAAPAGAVSQDNVSIRSLTIGTRTIRLDDGKSRAPIMVRAVDAEGKPVDLATELASGLIRVPGMTALDAMSGMDLGRMVQAGGDKPTRMQVFLSMKEQDNDAFADDSSPEFVLFGANAGGQLRVRAILDGTPDLPASLVMGSFRDVPASAFAQGTLPVRMQYAGASEPQLLGAVGLDLSGDLGVGPGKSVVGYEIELAAGATMPFKVLAAGQVEFGAYANYSEFASLIAKTTMGQTGPSLGAAAMADLGNAEPQIVGPVLLGEVERRPLNYDEPPPEVSQFDKPELVSFQDSSGGALNTPPVFPTTTTTVPAPGAALTLAVAGALGLGGRRRRS